VKYFIAIQAIISVGFFFPATAQNENWDMYMAKFAGKPGSVLVDLAYKDHAPDKNFPFLVITGPRAQNCGKNGLPGKDEIDALEDILNATSNFLTGITPKALVGTFTYNCERLNYYYVKDTQSLRTAIARMYNRSFQNYSYIIRIKPDPGWSVYRTFLYPDESTMTWMENDKLITKLLQSGDSLTTQRDIKFEIFLPADTGQNTVVSFAEEKGYKCEKVKQNAGVPYEIIVSKHDYVKIEDLDVMTGELKKEATRLHGYYNGWTAK
jgi:hypothetical protein